VPLAGTGQIGGLNVLSGPGNQGMTMMPRGNAWPIAVTVQ
jgi:hypothetical protein